MSILSSIATFMMGCGLFGFGTTCGLPVPGGLHATTTRSVAITTTSTATSSPQVHVTTTINGTTHTRTMTAPYGIQSSVVERMQNGKPVTEASTTPITKAQEQKIAQQAQQMQQQMNQMLAEQQQMFQQMQTLFTPSF